MAMRNFELIDSAIDETFNDLAAYLARRFTAEIRAEKWTWPRDPSPRDIVDTGNLAKSLRIVRSTRLDGSPEIQFLWSAPYAPAVHDGAVFKRTDAEGNPVTMPARPWTRPVLYDRKTIQAYTSRRFALAISRRDTA
jgi:hypothetical protein